MSRGSATMPAAARRRLYERSSHCYWCGLEMQYEAMHAHHRLERSHLGGWDLSNVVGLHGTCHNVAAGSVHQEPAKAYRSGILIRSGRATSLNFPAFDRGLHEWLTLSNDGTANPIPAPFAIELLESFGVNFELVV